MRHSTREKFVYPLFFLNINFLKNSLQFDRLGFKDELCPWRVTSINFEYKLCASYPQHLVVPKKFTDKELETCAKFRSSRRVPAVVWRYALIYFLAEAAEPANFGAKFLLRFRQLPELESRFSSLSRNLAPVPPLHDPKQSCTAFLWRWLRNGWVECGSETVISYSSRSRS